MPDYKAKRYTAWNGQSFGVGDLVVIKNDRLHTWTIEHVFCHRNELSDVIVYNASEERKRVPAVMLEHAKIEQ